MSDIERLADAVSGMVQGCRLKITTEIAENAETLLKDLSSPSVVIHTVGGLRNIIMPDRT